MSSLMYRIQQLVSCSYVSKNLETLDLMIDWLFMEVRDPPYLRPNEMLHICLYMCYVCKYVMKYY